MKRSTRSSPEKRHCHKRGFTLIELVMTIVVAGIIAIPLSLTISQYIKSVFKAQDYTMAVNLARAEIERVNKMPYTSMVTASFTNYQGYPYNVTRTVTYIAGSSGSTNSLKQIVVSVTKSGSAEVLANFTTYFARNVSYGL
jgi:prepilin-type N-terminal cleavage/methylation domain-containing protein